VTIAEVIDIDATAKRLKLKISSIQLNIDPIKLFISLSENISFVLPLPSKIEVKGSVIKFRDVAKAKKIHGGSQS
jgi:hypothetical protein